MAIKNLVQIMVKRLIKLAVLLVLLYGAVWCYFNWDYVLEKFGANYEVTRYGVVWNTNLSSAKRVAQKNNRNILVVYVNSGAKHAPSDLLIDRIIPTAQFKAVTDTYIPLLADVRQGVEEKVRPQKNREEIIKQYDLSNRYGQLLLLDPKGKELSRVQYSNQSIALLIDQLSGGKFKALSPIQRADVKNPFTESEKKGKKRGQIGRKSKPGRD
ncbi:MAG: hypothetical protein LBM70_06995 [Victivallales bacterium]|jgi:hypothetical protein|nr:hypothetical protein [Victivallales bacterium]